MCSAFIEALPPDVTAYPETAGWDILLVYPDGRQVGVQAKLHANIKVLAQAMEPRPHKPGPEVHAVLVPKVNWDFERVARMCDVLPISPGPISMELAPWLTREDQEAITARRRRSTVHAAVRLALGCTPREHPSRHELPPVVPTSVAGSPSPVVLTPWKVKAVKLSMLLRRRGHVTSKDFRELGLDPGYWRRALLEPNGEKTGRCQQLVARPGARLPDEEHPELVAHFEAEGGP